MKVCVKDYLLSIHLPTLPFNILLNNTRHAMSTLPPFKLSIHFVQISQVYDYLNSQARMCVLYKFTCISVATWGSASLNPSSKFLFMLDYHSLFWFRLCMICTLRLLYPPHIEVVGVYIGFAPSVRLSVRPSICPSIRPVSGVRSVASIVQDGFFPYLVQMITSMRGCVACDDPWPWPISSRSFGLDLENRVCSVASTVLDGFSLYLAQMITIIRGCVACYGFFSESENLNFWQILEIFWPWPWKNNLQFLMDSFHI